MEIGLLGPLEVFDDAGRPVVVAGAKLRALLAALALRPGQVVAAERLVEELWGPDAKTTAANSLQGLVSKLRRVLPADVLVTKPPGYVLDVPAEAVDVVRFERLAAEGRRAWAGGEEYLHEWSPTGDAPVGVEVDVCCVGGCGGHGLSPCVVSGRFQDGTMGR